MIKLGDSTTAAILMVMRFTGQATGTEPTQQEIASVLKSYFTLDEVTNQLSYLRHRPPDNEEALGFFDAPRLSLRINLSGASHQNSLARAGYFIEAIGEGLAAIRKHAQAVLGTKPSDAEISRSLMSNFILSELKNQIVYARRHPRRSA
ncbi:MAG TPA: hypothetical protein VLR50_19770 [Desulfobacterales bacterium]|nr:hypothetical protein [Desulfobacterales bacterium]